MESTVTPSRGQDLLNNTHGNNWTGAKQEGGGFKPTDDMSAIINAWRVIPPFLIVFGSIGNVLIIVVLIRSAMHKATTGMLFCALAASDLVGLYVGLLPQWVKFLTDTNYHQKGDFLCKFLPWIKYSVLDYSAWILVAVTSERVIATCFPLASKMTCTRRFAVGYLVSSGLIVLCINVHMLYGFEYTEEYIPGIGIIFYCTETTASYTYFFERVWPWIDVTVYCLLPFIVICVGNCLIVFRVKNSYNRSVVRRNVSMASNKNTLSLSRRKGKKQISTLTLTLLLINSAFFVSTFPVSVFQIVEVLSAEYFQQNRAQTEMWWVFVYNFMYLNNTFNIFLYCLSGSKFRQGALELIRRIWNFRFKTSSESVRVRPTGSHRSTDEELKDKKTTQNTPEGHTDLAGHSVEL